MKTRHSITATLLIILIIAFSSIVGAGSAGTLSGRAVDSSGRPIANAKIWVKPVVTTGLYETRTDANGKYLATGLPPVGYRVMGWFEREYQGKRFCLRLGHPSTSDYSPINPAKGATRDLLWRIQGRIEDIEAYSDMGYFGGSISVMNDSSLPARNTPLEFTLVPTKPLIDGSKGKTLTRRPNSEGYLLDVPVGVYKVSAVLLEQDRKTPVRLGTGSSQFESQATLEFQPEKNACTGNSASGVARSYLYWSKASTGSNSTPSATPGATPNSDGTVSIAGTGYTTSQDGMAGTWVGTLTVQGGETYLVRYEMIDTEYGEGFVGIGGDFFECESETSCSKIGEINVGKRVPGALVNFTTTLRQTGASFETVGHLEGTDTFKGITDAVFANGHQAVLNMARQ